MSRCGTLLVSVIFVAGMEVQTLLARALSRKPWFGRTARMATFCAPLRWTRRTTGEGAHHPFMNLTTFGQFGEQFDTLIEKIVQHRGELNDGPRMDGKSPQRVTLEFRQNFKMDLKIAMARGNALMITRAGRSRSFLRGRWVRV